MANLGIGSILLTTQAAKLYAGLGEAASKSKAMAQKIGSNISASVASGASRVGGLLATGLTVGATAGFAALGIGMHSAVESLKELAVQADMARVLGSTAEAFTGLAGAAETYGVDTGGLFEGLVSLSGKAAEALKGGDIAGVFKRIGLNVREFSALDPTSQFTALHGALQNIADPGERVRILLATMGEEAGKKLAPLLNKSRDELKAFTAQFAVSNAEMQRVKAADDAMRRVTASMSSLWRRVVVSIAPVVEAVAGHLTKAFEKLQPVFDWVLRGLTTHWGILIDVVGEAVSAIGEVISSVVAWVSEITGIGTTTEKIEDVVTGAWRAIGIAGAYCWDSIKAGVGAAAIAVGYLSEGVAELISVFADLAGLMKELPDELRPTGLDGFIAETERVRDSVKNAGLDMQKWGASTFEKFGQSAEQVRRWFDEREKKKKLEVAAEQKAAIKAPSESRYAPVAAAIAGTREAYSAEAKFRGESRLNPQLDAQKKMVQEQQRGNALLKEVVSAIGNINMNFGVI